MNQVPSNHSATQTPLDRWIFLGVVVFAFASGGQLFLWSWNHSDQTWWWMTHDRHAHYVSGLNLAMDVRKADFARLRHDLNSIRVWGPLHPLLQGSVQFVLGPDHRLAILPSLAGWVLTICLAFLVARRMLPEYGNAAGLVAAAMLASLPAYRAYATDVMLESIGAALTLMVLYCYLRAVQDRSRHVGVWLALSLIALFFHKYNYWLITIFGLILAELLRRPVYWWSITRWLVQPTIFGPLLRRESRSPFTWGALLLFSLASFVWITGGTTITFGEQMLPVNEPHNLFTVGFLALFIRLSLWWRAEGRALSARLDPVVRPALVWQGWACAIWFLLPKRLGYFLWFLSPANSDQSTTRPSLVNGGRYYLNALKQDYCVWPWELMALLVFIVVAALLVRRLRPGSVAVFSVFAIGAFLTINHVMIKNRFAHSWVAPAWILASVGLFAVCPLLAKYLGQPIIRSASVLVSLFAVGVHAPSWRAPAHAQESGPKPLFAQPLRITNTYLPLLKDAKHTQILSNVDAKFLFSWTFMEAHRNTNFETDIKSFKESLERNPAALRQWLEQTKSDALVLIEMEPQSPHAPGINSAGYNLTTMRQALSEQDRFRRVKTWELPEGVKIALWRR